MTNLLHGAHVANKLFSTIARLRLLLVMFVALSVSVSAWGAEGDEHTVTDVNFEKLLNNSAQINDVTISDPGYPIKKIIVNCRYNKTAGGVTISIKIGGKTFASSKTHNSNSTVNIEFTDEAMQGDVVFSFVNNCGSGTGKGTFYFNSVTLVEGASTSTTPYAVTFYKTSKTYEEVLEASAGDGVTPPSMEEKCGDWTFLGWSESYSDSETSTTELKLVTLTDGKYYPTDDVHLYPVYSKTISSGSAFSDYQKVTTNLDDWSGKYLLSTGTYTATGVYSSNHLTCTNGAPGNVECSDQEFTLSKVGNVGYSILMPNGNYLGYSGSSTNFSSSPNVPTNTSTTFLWTPSTSGISNVSATARKISTNNNNTDFRPYSSPSSGIVYLYKRIENSSTIYYYSYPSCTTQTTVFVIPKCGGDGGGTWLVVIEWFATL